MSSEPSGPHGHSHHHPETHDSFAEANKAHFDAEATTFDDKPGLAELSRRLSKVLLESYTFDENTTTLMDYACGTGMLSRELAPYTKSIIGVDISQGMVDQFNLRVSNQGIPPEEMRAICSELKGVPGELEDAKFDAIVCALAYHHFSSIDDVTRTLAFFLKPGGTLLIIDILQPEITHESAGLFPTQYHHIVPHTHGFEEAGIRKVFEGAGLTQFEFKPKIASARFHGDVDFFLAKGTRPVNV